MLLAYERRHMMCWIAMFSLSRDHKYAALCSTHRRLQGGVFCPWEELLVETERRGVSVRRFGGVQPGTALKCCCRQPWDGTFSFQLLMALWIYEETKFTQPTSYVSPMLQITSSLPIFLHVVWHAMEHMFRILCNEHNAVSVICIP